MMTYASCSAICQEAEGGLAGSGAGVGVAFPPRILYITVPQVGHLPLIALRPFLVVTSTASTISFLALHLTQYPSGIEKLAAAAPHAPGQLWRIPYVPLRITVNREKPVKIRLLSPL